MLYILFAFGVIGTVVTLIAFLRKREPRWAFAGITFWIWNGLFRGIHYVSWMTEAQWLLLATYFILPTGILILFLLAISYFLKPSVTIYEWFWRFAGFVAIFLAVAELAISMI